MSKDIHRNPMKRSSEDTVALGDAVEHRFLSLCQSWLRIRGEVLFIPPEIDSAMLLWRKMMIRHRQGVFLNTDDELKALKTIAQWTVDMNCDLRGQDRKKVKWEE